MSRRRRKPPLSPSKRAALVARERVLEIRRAVDMVRRLRERRGTLTLAQIQRTRRLLADRAEELYRRADRVERGTAAPRLPRALSLAALARRAEQAGYRDDPVTSSTCARLVELGAAIDGKPVTPATLRSAAIELLVAGVSASDAELIELFRRNKRVLSRSDEDVIAAMTHPR